MSLLRTNDLFQFCTEHTIAIMSTCNCQCTVLIAFKQLHDMWGPADYTQNFTYEGMCVSENESRFPMMLQLVGLLPQDPITFG